MTSKTPGSLELELAATRKVLREAVLANLHYTAWTGEHGDISEAIVEGRAEIPLLATVPGWVTEALALLRRAD